MNMKAYVLIKVRTGDVKDVVRQLKKIEHVLAAHMTFGPYDAVAFIESTDISGLGSLIASTIQPIPGIEQTLTCIAVDV
jgi:DNA-binding Lrp family transcriptional regulator